jgi:hypothetical protein
MTNRYQEFPSLRCETLGVTRRAVGRSADQQSMAGAPGWLDPGCACRKIACATSHIDSVTLVYLFQ